MSPVASRGCRERR